MKITLECNRDELQKTYDEMNHKYNMIHDSAIGHIKNILNGFISDNNIGDICSIGHCEVEYFEIVIKDNKNLYNINLSFNNYKDVYSDEYNLSINFSSFGSFYAEDNVKINYTIVLGKIAEHFKDIESKIKDFDWNAFHSLRKEYCSAESNLHMYDYLVREKDKAIEIEKIREKLIVGAKIKVGTRYVWEDNGNKIVDDIRTINKVMPKNLEISGFYHRVKKEDCLIDLYHNKWSLVD